eukprot:scaffold297_cov386-Prasinococcus_capsulatus_cf.AAC.12
MSLRALQTQHPFEAKRKKATVPLLRLCIHPSNCTVIQHRKLFRGQHPKVVSYTLRGVQVTGAVPPRRS